MALPLREQVRNRRDLQPNMPRGFWRSLSHSKKGSAVTPSTSFLPRQPLGVLVEPTSSEPKVRIFRV
jgi:hypothetical protein